MSAYLASWQWLAAGAQERARRPRPPPHPPCRLLTRVRLALGAAALTTAVVGWLPEPVSAQTEAHGLVHGFIGMMNVIDHNTAVPSSSARFGLGLYYTSFHPDRFGPEFAFTGVLDAVSVNIASSINAGVSYQIGERLSIGAGGTVLIGLKRWVVETLDPHYGGYVGLTWLAMPIGSWTSLTAQFRQQVLYDVGTRRVVLYPSFGIGLTFVPEGALIDFD